MSQNNFAYADESISETDKSDYDKKKQVKDSERSFREYCDYQKKHARHAVIFTGPALEEIFRDLTMQKSFMTLAYLSDMMIGSEITPF